jgi:nucleoside-diphosphate-sugar epimerase
MTTLVTGATGFIGPHLVERLRRDGASVRALVRPGTESSSLEALGAEVVRGDVRNPADAERAVRGCTTVYHLAARTSHGNLPASEMYSINVAGTRNVAEACVGADVERLVLCSTTRVYGIIRNHSVNEETELRPDSPYPDSKMRAERLLIDLHASHGLPVVIGRITSVFGPGSRSWLPLFREIAAGRFRLLGIGDNYQQPADVADVVEGLVLCGQPKATDGRIYLLAGEEALRLRAMIDLIAEELGAPRPPSGRSSLPLRAYSILGELARRVGVGRVRLPRYDRVEFFVNDRIFDISRAKGELGYRPIVSVRDAIRHTADSYREQGLLPA